MMLNTHTLIKAIFLILCLSISYPFVFGQSLIDTFDIASYYRPDLERRTMAFQPSFGSLNNNLSTNNNKRTDFSASLRLFVRQTKFVNSATYQINQTISGITNLTFDEEPLNSQRKNFFSAEAGLNFNYSKRYFRASEKMLQVGLNLRTNASYSRFRFINNERVTHDFTPDLSISLPVYKGKGRIELVNDAWHALQILDFLEQQQLITSVVSKEAIEAFANTISEIKNFRNTDPRFQLIDQYEVLCQYLIDSDLVDTDNYRFFPHLLDAWQFESFIQRLSGREIKFGLEPTISINERSFINEEATEERIDINNRLLFAFEINHYQPKNKDWQFNQFHRFSAGYVGSKSVFNNNSNTFFDDALFLSEGLLANWNSSWQLQYLPNQRSNYTLTYTIGYQYNRNLNTDNFFTNQNNANLNGSFRFDYQYYISPQFTFDILVDLRLNWGHFDIEYFTNRNSISFFASYRFY